LETGDRDQELRAGGGGALGEEGTAQRQRNFARGLRIAAPNLRADATQPPPGPRIPGEEGAH